MKADQFIVSRVSSETKARLRALAEKELLSESALLRRLVELVLLKAGLAPIITETPTGARARRGARLMIRLRPDDQILLQERAAARGMPPATYVGADASTPAFARATPARGTAGPQAHLGGTRKHRPQLEPDCPCGQPRTACGKSWA